MPTAQRDHWRFCEQELEQIVLCDKPSLLIADLLLEIFLLDREQKVVLHVEIQEKVNRALPRRMFNYFVRIYALKGFPVIRPISLKRIRIQLLVHGDRTIAAWN